MKRFLLPAATLLLASQTFSQHGTLLIATITKNSIIVAADSRVAYSEDTNNDKSPVIAYADSVCKIFKFKQFAIAVSGVFSLGCDFYSKAINAFNKTKYYDTSLYNTAKKFVAFLDEKYPVSLFPSRNTNNIMAAGYVNGQPQIASIDSSKNISLFRNIGTLYSAPEVKKYIIKNSTKINLSIYKNIENTFYDYASGENKVYIVGGPISMVEITPSNKIIWKQNDFTLKNYSVTSEFKNAVKTDKIKVNYLVPNGKARVLATIKDCLSL